MTALAALLAGLAGSLHCAGMCGGFVVLATGGGGRGPWPTVGWNLGRLTAYAGLGALAAALTGGVDRATSAWLGVQWVATVALLLMSVGLLVRSVWPRRATAVGLVQIGQRPGLFERLGARVARFARRGGAGAPFVLGLASALLPCAWLWSFVALAAATAQPLAGAALMGAFWLGTVPALVAVGGLAGRIGQRLKRHAARVTAVGMALAAVLTLGLRWDHGLRAEAAAERGEDFTCHSAPSAPAGAGISESKQAVVP